MSRTIIYSPECRGTVWLGMGKGEARTDFEVRSTEGLLELIEFKAGLHTPDQDALSRLLAYRDAISGNVAGTIYEDPFKLDELGTAKACLKMRDELHMIGWDGDKITGIEKIDDLCRFEKDFLSCGFPSAAERADKLIGMKVDMGDIVIRCPLPKELLPKKIAALLDSLRNGGKPVSFIQLEGPESTGTNLSDFRKWLELEDLKASDEPADPAAKIPFCPVRNDGSLEIWEFKDEVEAMEYITSLPDDTFDLWLNEDNGMFDTWQVMAGKPSSGSSSMSGLHPALQLVSSVVGMFLRPDSPEMFAGYLNNPYCPIERHSSLALSLLGNGGKEKWVGKDGGKYEHALLPEADKFTTDGHNIDKKYLVDFLRRITSELGRNIGNCKHPELAGDAIGMFKALGTVADRAAGDKIATNDLEKMYSSLMSVADFTLTEPRTGSRYVVAQTDNVLAGSRRTIWISATHHNQPSGISDLFLSKDFNKLKEAGCGYLADDQMLQDIRYRKALYELPVKLCSDRLVLVNIKRKDVRNRPLSPLLVRLYNYDKFDDPNDDEKPEDKKKYNPVVVMNPDTSILERTMESGSLLNDNELDQDDKGIVKCMIPEGKRIKWRPTESASSLEMLIQSPFEYAMKYISGFYPDDRNELPGESLVKGNVAHITIQTLLCDKKVRTRKDIDDCFDECFDNAVQAKGLSLLGASNESRKLALKNKVRNAAYALLEFLEDNGLEAEGYELSVNDDKAKILCEEDAEEKIKVTGSIDLLVRRKNLPNHKIIIDFKYTNKPDSYISRLTENRALQLALYKRLYEINIPEEDDTVVDATAYFLMSDKVEPRLHTKDDIDIFRNGGWFVNVITGTESYDSIIDRIKGSYWKRREQIDNGDVELGVSNEDKKIGIDIDKLEYYEAMADHALLPLGIVRIKGKDTKAVGYTKFNNATSEKK